MMHSFRILVLHGLKTFGLCRLHTRGLKPHGIQPRSSLVHNHWPYCVTTTNHVAGHFGTWGPAQWSVILNADQSLNTFEFSLNGAELSLNPVNSGNSENLRNHWSMNWVQYKDLLCYFCVCGLVVSSLSLTQEILGSSPTLLFLYFINFFLSLNSQNSVKTFRENSIVHLLE